MSRQLAAAADADGDALETGDMVVVVAEEESTVLVLMVLVTKALDRLDVDDGTVLVSMREDAIVLVPTEFVEELEDCCTLSAAP